MRDQKRARSLLLVAGLLLLNAAPSQAVARTPTAAQVEPQAGGWKTWVLASGAQFRLPAPPDAAATRAEIDELKTLVPQRDGAAMDKIAFWDTGAPGYRWDALVRSELAKHGVVMASAVTSRQLSLVDVAIYDATVAAWDTKYAYNRVRPSELDSNLQTVIANPESPAYPSEHAVVAGAASAVLAYLFPDDADTFAAMADEAARSRVMAGVQYPSDTTAGLDLGHHVADLVIDRARHDGSDVPWSGSIPNDPRACGTWMAIRMEPYPSRRISARSSPGSWSQVASCGPVHHPQLIRTRRPPSSPR